MTIRTCRNIRNALVATTFLCFFSGCAQLEDDSKLFGNNQNPAKTLVGVFTQS